MTHYNLLGPQFTISTTLISSVSGSFSGPSYVWFKVQTYVDVLQLDFFNWCMLHWGYHQCLLKGCGKLWFGIHFVFIDIAWYIILETNCCFCNCHTHEISCSCLLVRGTLLVASTTKLVWLCVYIHVIEVYFGNFVLFIVRWEIKILCLFMHPHIIWLYEVIETLSNTFVVMEYVKSMELFDYIVEMGWLVEEEAHWFF